MKRFKKDGTGNFSNEKKERKRTRKNKATDIFIIVILLSIKF